ncbi:hypothetical protein LCGC14_0546570 [marine sediment metagenome]|uniref:Glycosyl transferase family 1 domain-containing protein n=1 Tax=marine sediment metagenome TaxID=412755 RepID=A0A0F9S9P0_9ZZZZ
MTKINILIVTTLETKGGAFKSLKNIVESLKDIKNFNIKILTQKIKNKYLKVFGIDSYLSSLKIIKEILKFKPNIIITQLEIAFPTVIIAKIKKIPIINIIRGTSEFCPKYVDIVDYGKSCSGLSSRKKCFKCIENWRSLRVLIGNKQKGWEYSLASSISNILYKIRYFICRFNLYLLNKFSVNLVASYLMLKCISNWVYFEKVRILNITPISRHYKDNKYINKENRLIFVMPTDDASYKGLDFILRLIKFIPKNYYVLIVGGEIPEYKREWKQDGLMLTGYIYSKERLNIFYQESTITLVPTFCNESFGRGIIESLENKTPVISSPQCGANQFFGQKDFLKVIPLKLDLWVRAIKDIIDNLPIIDDNDVSEIYKQFSLERSRNDFVKIIDEVLNISTFKLYDIFGNDLEDFIDLYEIPGKVSIWVEVDNNKDSKEVLMNGKNGK